MTREEAARVRSDFVSWSTEIDRQRALHESTLRGEADPRIAELLFEINEREQKVRTHNTSVYQPGPRNRVTGRLEEGQVDNSLQRGRMAVLAKARDAAIALQLEVRIDLDAKLRELRAMIEA